jgi:hypothetical protein
MYMHCRNEIIIMSRNTKKVPASYPHSAFNHFAVRNGGRSRSESRRGLRT